MQCSATDNSVCITCAPGLAILRAECFAECPPDYQKSYDGITCEIRTYPLNRYFAPFPFLCLLTLFYLIILASYLITKKATLPCQNMISSTALVLVVCLLFQSVAAIFQGNQPLVIVSDVILLIANLIVNVAYLFTFKY